MTLMRKNESYPTWSNFFNEFLDRDWLDWTNKHFSETNTTLPAVNIYESADAFEVEMAAPGLEKKDFNIEFNHGILTISSEKKSEKESKKIKNFNKQEFSYQSFSRSFSLPDTVNSEKINAVYKDGILKVIIPKKEEAKPRPPKTIKIS